MKYKQRQKNSPFYWTDDNWCHTKKEWLQRDKKAEFIDLGARLTDLNTKPPDGTILSEGVK